MTKQKMNLQKCLKHSCQSKIGWVRDGSQTSKIAQTLQHNRETKLGLQARETFSCQPSKFSYVETLALLRSP